MFQVMRQIPNVSASDLHKLDEKLSAAPAKGNKIEKGKKDLFKKITSQVRLFTLFIVLPHFSKNSSYNYFNFMLV